MTLEEEEAASRSLLSIENNLDGGFDDVNTNQGVTCMLIFSSLTIVSGSYVAGNAMGYTSPAESGILEDLGLSLAAFSVFGSILSVGGLIGAASCGIIADLIGRRGAIWFSNIFCIAGWCALTFSKAAWSLDLGRLLQGFGTAILSYVVPIYIAEITPKNFRGAFVSLTMLMTGCGVSFTFVLGSFCHWRILALLGTVPCLIQVLGAFFIPESPRWLAKVGREKELEIALQHLRGKNADVSLEVAEILVCTKNLDQIAEYGIIELFQQRYTRAVIIGVGLMTLASYGGLNAYTYYTKFILESAGFPGDVGSISTGIVQIVMNICGMLLVDKCGRRPLLLVASTGMCLASFITGLSFLLQGYHVGKEITPVLALTGILIFVGSISIGMGGIPWIIVAEIFPVNIKGAAGSLVNLVSLSGSSIVAYTFNFLFEWSSAGVFFSYAIISGMGVVFVAKLVPETKGRTLEEIQASLITN